MRFLCICSLLFLFSGVAVAQDYVLTMGGGDLLEGESDSFSVILDNNGDDIQGWSIGVCNDTAFLTFDDVVDGATTATVQNGAAPGFNQISLFADGFTVGVVICFTGCAVLAPGTDYELNVATYTAVAEGTTELAFCDTLGSPSVVTVIVVGGASIPPGQNSGTVNVTVPPPVPDPEFNYFAENTSANYNPADGEANVSIAVSISETDNSGLGAPFPVDTQGFSMGLSNSAEVAPTAVNVSLPFDAGFAESSLFSDGWTLGVVYSFTGGVVLPFDTELEVVSVDYETGGSMAGDQVGATVDLAWSDLLGSPSVVNVVVVDGGSFPAGLNNGSITLNPVVTIDFIRGDVNGDDKVNIADGIWIIYELFLGGPASACPISRDANGDGFTDTADAITVFNYRFLSGPAPAAPFPECGQDPSQTPEDCDSSFCG